MAKLFTMKPELLEKIVPYECEKHKGVKDFVIQMPDGNFLHWIEVVDNTPCRISDPRMTMQRWPFREQAQAICDHLKELWSEERIKRESRPDCKEFFDRNKDIIVTVKIEEN